MREPRSQLKLPRVPLAKQGRVKQRKCDLTACRERSQEQSMEAVGLCLPHATWVDLLSLNPGHQRADSVSRPLTGKPDAGNPPVRFGGRGGFRAIPTPIQDLLYLFFNRAAP